MMKKPENRVVFLFIFLIQSLFITLSGQQPVQKTNPVKVYMHYMPWFETPSSIGKWGWHWTMNNQNPNIIGTDGKRQIASHYYPLIGPYASRDRDVIEYHFLLLKLSGIDGILVNWYGVAGSNGDLKDLLKSSDSIVSYTDDFGLQFGVVMEDRFSRSITDVKSNISYLKDHYFTRPEYIRYGENKDPLVCIFGPITFQSPLHWTEILPSAGEDVEFLTLWNESGDAGSNADGEFAWVFQDNTNHMTHLENFYKNRAPGLKTAAGSAYPGFEDFYEEGGAGEGYFTIPPYFGSTLDATLKKAEQYKNDLDMIQLVTFNDFGEGTMFEPTLETGFSYLERIQTFTGVDYGETELKLVHRLYSLRKKYGGNKDIQDQLDQASEHIRNLEIHEAELIIRSVELSTGLTGYYQGEGEESLPFVFPNPVNNKMISFTCNPVFSPENRIIIMSVSGKVLYENCLPVNTTTYSINNLLLPEGIYFLKIIDGQTITTTRFCSSYR